LTYDTKDNEKELILPAINGVKAIMEAAASNSAIQRVIITSSFAAVLNTGRTAPPYFTYTGADWNPLTYADSIDPSTSAVIAYRGSKKFAELAAWEFVERENPSFDIVALCPPMTFGPVVHHIGGIDNLNESNAALWKVASGEPLPVARVPFWIDVRDLAEAHVEALLRPEAGGKRYIPASPELFSYQLAADIMLEEFEWARGKVVKETEQKIDGSHGLDGETVAKELGVKYTSFRQTVVDLVSQAMEMSKEG
jgi:nucleoside-diphosphate-sugar epimerase